jgi:predicted nucleic-acid-binding Zn-ribbon protein
MSTSSTCPECNGNRVYRQGGISAGGGYAPNYLAGLGSFWKTARFTIAVCADCGLTRYYASPEARAKLANNDAWRRG